MMYDDDGDDLDREDYDEPLPLTPIERAIQEERAMLLAIRKQDREIARLHKELGAMSSKLMAAAQSSSAWMLHAALAGAFTKESVEAMGDRPDTVIAAIAAAASRNNAE